MTTYSYTSEYRALAAHAALREGLRFLSVTAARTVLYVVAMLVLWSVVPVAFGWHAAAVMSGSMAPELSVGSLIVAAPTTSETMRPGAIILADLPGRPGELLSHRIVRMENGRIVTKGDANQTEDSVHLVPDAVHGVVRLVVPIVGSVQPWWQNRAYGHLSAAGALLLLSGWIVFADGLRAQSDGPTRGRRRRPVVRGWAAVAASMTALAGTLVWTPADAAFTATTGNPGDHWATSSSFVFAQDDFSQSTSSGLGTADIGGNWIASTTSGSATQSVSGASAAFRLQNQGDAIGSHLAPVTKADVDIRTTIWFSDVPDGSGASIYVVGRRVASNLAYRAQIRLYSDGGGYGGYGGYTSTANRIGVSIIRVDASGTTTIGNEYQLPNYDYNTGDRYSSSDRLKVHMVLSGTSPTRLSVTVYRPGTTEPLTPTVAASDSTAALQTAGSVGLSARMAGTVSSGYNNTTGMTAHADDFLARKGTL